MALLALLGLGAWALISAISDVGLQTIVDELAAAQDQWLWAALLLSPSVQVAEAAAVSTALILRVVTRYLPLAWGSFAIRALRAREYI